MIPSQWPDLELWAIEYLSPSLPDATVRNRFDEPPPPFSHVFVVARPGSRVTPISRQLILDIEVRVRRADNSVDLAEQRRVADQVGFLLESVPRDGNPVVYLEVESGPTRVDDPVDGPECHELTVIGEVHRL